MKRKGLTLFTLAACTMMAACAVKQESKEPTTAAAVTTAEAETTEAVTKEPTTDAETEATTEKPTMEVTESEDADPTEATQEEPAKDKDYIVDMREADHKEYVDASACKNLVIKASQVKAPDDFVRYQVISNAMTVLGTRNVERPVEVGDTVTLDFTGYIDGVAFPGGADTDYSLGIGSGQFIPGFESGLIGAKIGEEVSINVTFPENYGDTDYAGKDAVFKVLIKEIITVDDPDDATVKEKTGLDNLEEFCKSLEEDIRESHKDGVLLDIYFANVKELKVHEGLVNECIMLNYETLDSYAAMFGMSREDFLINMYGFESEEAFLQYIERDAKQYAFQKMAVVAIADELGLECTEQECAEYVAGLADTYEVTEEEVLAEYGGESGIYFEIIYNKVFEYACAAEIAED